MKLVSKIKKKISLFLFWRHQERLFLKLKNDIQNKNAVLLNQSPHPRVLIFSSDPWNLIDSRGEQAMLTVAVNEVKRRYPDAEIAFFTSDRNATKAVEHFGARAFEVLNGRDAVANIDQILRTFCPDCGIIIGADVIDGHYSAHIAQDMVIVAELLLLYHKKAIFTGFSWNRVPHPAVRRMIGFDDGSLVWNLRDCDSQARFIADNHKPARLTADVAFLLEPDAAFADFAKFKSWCQEQHVCQRTILGVNIHTQLYKNLSAALLASQQAAFAGVLNSSLEKYQCSLLLIPHDYHVNSDLNMLREIMSMLDPRFSDRIKIVDGTYSAPQLKSVVGLTDCLISGRMHLGIGALSQAIPTIFLSYQDKCEGLLKHCELSIGDFLLQPNDLHDCKKCVAAIGRLIDQRHAISEKLQLRLPFIRTLAASTFDQL